jgi:hypothetical protein
MRRSEMRAALFLKPVPSVLQEHLVLAGRVRSVDCVAQRTAHSAAAVSKAATRSHSARGAGAHQVQPVAAARLRRPRSVAWRPASARASHYRSSRCATIALAASQPRRSWIGTVMIICPCSCCWFSEFLTLSSLFATTFMEARHAQRLAPSPRQQEK